MIQRVFYGKLGVRPDEVPGWDLTAREHLELWPFAALFLAMGVASPFWMRAIDTYGTVTAAPPQVVLAASSNSSVDGLSQRENPCATILAEMRQHIPDVNYDKKRGRGICNSDGTLVDPDWYYSRVSQEAR